MHNDTISAGAELVGEEYFEKTKSAVAKGGADPPELAAELVAFLVSDQSRGITGKLLSVGAGIPGEKGRSKSGCDPRRIWRRCAGSTISSIAASGHRTDEDRTTSRPHRTKSPASRTCHSPIARALEASSIMSAARGTATNCSV